MRLVAWLVDQSLWWCPAVKEGDVKSRECRVNDNRRDKTRRWGLPDEDAVYFVSQYLCWCCFWRCSGWFSYCCVAVVLTKKTNGLLFSASSAHARLSFIFILMPSSLRVLFQKNVFSKELILSNLMPCHGYNLLMYGFCTFFRREFAQEFPWQFPFSFSSCCVAFLAEVDVVLPVSVVLSFSRVQSVDNMHVFLLFYFRFYQLNAHEMATLFHLRLRQQRLSG